MTWCTRDLITSTFTVDAGTVDHITTDRGGLSAGEDIPLSFSGTRSTISGITVTWSSGDMSTIELAMMVDSTVPNFVAKDETDNTFKLSRIRSDMRSDTERRRVVLVAIRVQPGGEFVHIVVIHGWREATAELMQALAAILGVTVFEMRQRMMGDGPAVVASFADPYQAGSLAEKLRQCGVSTLVVDAAEARSRSGRFMVRRFELGGSRLSRRGSRRGVCRDSLCGGRPPPSGHLHRRPNGDGDGYRTQTERRCNHSFRWNSHDEKGGAAGGGTSRRAREGPFPLRREQAGSRLPPERHDV